MAIYLNKARIEFLRVLTARQSQQGAAMRESLKGPSLIVKGLLQEIKDNERAWEAAQRTRNLLVPDMSGFKGSDASEGARKFGEQLDSMFRRPVDPNKAN